MLREPVHHEVDGWDVTIDSVVADSEGTRVAVTIYGPFKMTGDRFKQPDVEFDGFIQARDRNGMVSSQRGRIFPMSHGFSKQGTSISCTANMDPLTAGDHQIDIFINEPVPPITIIPVTLTPIDDLSIPARTLDVSDEHHGVVITAEAIARGSSMTAVLLQTTLRPHPRQRFMRGLGVRRDDPRSGAPGVTIDDGSGSPLTAFAGTREPSSGPEIRTIAVFPGVADQAREVTITIPYVVLCEYTGAPVTLTVPSEADITLGDDSAHVKVERQTAPRGGASVGVEITGSWSDDRRLLYAESLTVGDKYGGVGFKALPDEPPIQTYAEDPTGTATAVTLESPNIELRGPWLLRAALP